MIRRELRGRARSLTGGSMRPNNPSYQSRAQGYKRRNSEYFSDLLPTSQEEALQQQLDSKQLEQFLHTYRFIEEAENQKRSNECALKQEWNVKITKRNVRRNSLVEALRCKKDLRQAIEKQGKQRWRSCNNRWKEKRQDFTKALNAYVRRREKKRHQKDRALAREVSEALCFPRERNCISEGSSQDGDDSVPKEVSEEQVVAEEQALNEQPRIPSPDSEQVISSTMASSQLAGEAAPAKGVVQIETEEFSADYEDEFTAMCEQEHRTCRAQCKAHFDHAGQMRSIQVSKRSQPCETSHKAMIHISKAKKALRESANRLETADEVYQRGGCRIETENEEEEGNVSLEESLFILLELSSDLPTHLFRYLSFLVDGYREQNLSVVSAEMPLGCNEHPKIAARKLGTGFNEAHSPSPCSTKDVEVDAVGPIGTVREVLLSKEKLVDSLRLSILALYHDMGQQQADEAVWHKGFHSCPKTAVVHPEFTQMKGQIVFVPAKIIRKIQTAQLVEAKTDLCLRSSVVPLFWSLVLKLVSVLTKYWNQFQRAVCSIPFDIRSVCLLAMETTLRAPTTEEAILEVDRKPGHSFGIMFFYLTFESMSSDSIQAATLAQSALLETLVRCCAALVVQPVELVYALVLHILSGDGKQPNVSPLKACIAEELQQAMSEIETPDTTGNSVCEKNVARKLYLEAVNAYLGVVERTATALSRSSTQKKGQHQRDAPTADFSDSTTLAVRIVEKLVELEETALFLGTFYAARTCWIGSSRLSDSLDATLMLINYPKTMVQYDSFCSSFATMIEAVSDVECCVHYSAYNVCLDLKDLASDFEQCAQEGSEDEASESTTQVLLVDHLIDVDLSAMFGNEKDESEQVSSVWLRTLPVSQKLREQTSNEKHVPQGGLSTAVIETLTQDPTFSRRCRLFPLEAWTHFPIESATDRAIILDNVFASALAYVIDRPVLFQKKLDPETMDSPLGEYHCLFHQHIGATMKRAGQVQAAVALKSSRLYASLQVYQATFKSTIRQGLQEKLQLLFRNGISALDACFVNEIHPRVAAIKTQYLKELRGCRRTIDVAERCTARLEGLLSDALRVTQTAEQRMYGMVCAEALSLEKLVQRWKHAVVSIQNEAPAAPGIISSVKQTCSDLSSKYLKHSMAGVFCLFQSFSDIVQYVAEEHDVEKASIAAEGTFAANLTEILHREFADDKTLYTAFLNVVLAYLGLPSMKETARLDKEWDDITQQLLTVRTCIYKQNIPLTSLAGQVGVLKVVLLDMVKLWRQQYRFLQGLALHLSPFLCQAFDQCLTGIKETTVAIVSQMKEAFKEKYTCIEGSIRLPTEQSRRTGS